MSIVKISNYSYGPTYHNVELFQDENNMFLSGDQPKSFIHIIRNRNVDKWRIEGSSADYNIEFLNDYQYLIDKFYPNVLPKKYNQSWPDYFFSIVYDPLPIDRQKNEKYNEDEIKIKQDFIWSLAKDKKLDYLIDLFKYRNLNNTEKNDVAYAISYFLGYDDIISLFQKDYRLNRETLINMLYSGKYDLIVRLATEQYLLNPRQKKEFVMDLKDLLDEMGNFYAMKNQILLLKEKLKSANPIEFNF